MRVNVTKGYRVFTGFRSTIVTPLIIKKLLSIIVNWQKLISCTVCYYYLYNLLQISSLFGTLPPNLLPGLCAIGGLPPESLLNPPSNFLDPPWCAGCCCTTRIGSVTAWCLSQSAQDIVSRVDWAGDGERKSSQAAASENWLGGREDADQLVHILALPISSGLWTLLALDFQYSEALTWLIGF